MYDYRRTGIPPSCDCVTPSLGYQHVKDTAQELVDALDVRTTSILERITDTWILIIEAQAGDEGYFSNYNLVT